MTELYKDIQVTVTAKTGESNYEEGAEKHFEKIIDCLRMVNFDGVSMTTHLSGLTETFTYKRWN